MVAEIAEVALEARRLDVGVGTMVAIWKRFEVVIVATVVEIDETTLLMVVVALASSETTCKPGAGGRSIRQRLRYYRL